MSTRAPEVPVVTYEAGRSGGLLALRAPVGDSRDWDATRDRAADPVGRSPATVAVPVAPH